MSSNVPDDAEEIYVPRVLRYCFLRTCKNNSQMCQQKNFFPVPNGNKEEWCLAAGVPCHKRQLYLCEDHLNLEEDVQNYFDWVTFKKRPKLKPRLPKFLDVIPTQNQDEDSPCSSSAIKGSCESVTTRSKDIQIKPRTIDPATNCSSLIQKKDKNAPLSGHFKMEEIDSDETIPSSQESTFSASISTNISEVSEHFVVKPNTFMFQLIKKKPDTYIGLPKEYYWVIDFLQSKLNIDFKHIIITLYKIKCNALFEHIADMFQVSLTTLWRMFFKTVSLLSKFFKQLIFAPNIVDVKKNLPASFTTNNEYSNVYCIIDCLEIEIEKPSDPVHQELTWSQYKNANTLKYLLATTPDGFIIFVSAGYGGRTSDANIVETCGFLDFLPYKCIILADRGFKDIDTMLSRKQITLLRPPSVSKDTKLTKTEAIKSKVIASLRIHIEKVIRRVRLYKFLEPHSVINNKMIQHTDNVIIVACGLINLQNPIVKM